MIIGVAGPYSADSEDKRKLNLDRINFAAAKLLEMGHIPLIGVNAALPVVEKANIDDKYNAIMDISLAVMESCEALLILNESPGVLKEKNFILSKGLPVYYNFSEIPLAG